MPKFRIEIEIDYVKVGCNQGPLIIETEQSDSGAKKLTKYLKRIFGETSVHLLKDVSTVVYREVL